MNYAIINDSIVTNIVVWDGDDNLFESDTTVPIDDIPCGIGWKYEKGKFIKPHNPDSVLPEA